MNLFANIDKKAFVSVYDQTESDGNFHVCRYLGEDDIFGLFQTVSTRGYDDGYYLVLLDYIYRVDIDDEYTERIKKLFELQRQPYYDCQFEDEKSLLVNLLSFSKQNNYVISIFLENGENITGHINCIDPDDEVVKVDKLTEDGDVDGVSLVALDLIEKVICNSGVERCIEMLAENK